MGSGSRHAISDSEAHGSEEQHSPVWDESGRLLDGASRKLLVGSKAKLTHVGSIAASAASTGLPSSPRSSEASASSFAAGETEVLEETSFQRAVSSPPEVSAPSIRGAIGVASAGKRSPPSAGLAPRLALLVNGSEGDVRPMIALAKHLKETHGHDARIFTNANMVELCHRHGIAAVAVFSNSQEVLERAGGLSGISGVVEAMRKPWKEAKLWAKEHPGACVAAEKAMMEFSPHAVLLGTQALATAMLFEDRYGVPVLPVYLSRPYLEVDCIRQVADTEPARPSFFAHSKSLDEGPTGLRRLVHTGAWLLEEGSPAEEELAPDGRLGRLRAFLRDGPPPVCFGWGSMVVDEHLQAEAILQLVFTALKEIGCRGVVLGGWMCLHERGREVLDRWNRSNDAELRELASFAEQEVCFVQDAPHEWLFPQCCCVVHHGGVGTVHAALRAGVPSVITPVCADQFDFATTVTDLNVGIGLEALCNQNLPQLVWGLKRATGEMFARSIADVSQRMLREEMNALPQAGSVIDGFVRKTVMTGQWARSLAQRNLKMRQIPVASAPASPALGPKVAPDERPKAAAPGAKAKAKGKAKAKAKAAAMPILKSEAVPIVKIEDVQVDLPTLRLSSASSIGSVSTQGRGQEPEESEAADPEAGAEVRIGSKPAPELKAPVVELSLSKAFAMQYELWASYASSGFQAKLTQCETRTGSVLADRARLCLEVQKAVLPKYGFEGNPRGVSAMMQVIKQHYSDKVFLMRTVLINNILELGVVTPPREAVPVMRALPESLRSSAGFSRLVRVRLAWRANSQEISVPACEETTLREFHWFLAHSFGANEDTLRTCGFVEMSSDGESMFSLDLTDRVPDRVGIESEDWPFMPITTPPETFLSMGRLRALHQAVLAAISDGHLTRSALTQKEENYQHFKSRLTRQLLTRVIPQFGFTGNPRGVRMATSAFFVHTWHPEVLSWLEEFETAVSRAVPWRPTEGSMLGERLLQPQAQQLNKIGA